MYEKIKKFYGLGLYTSEHVACFVEKGKLSELDYQEIVGQAYTK